jgi:hypothetical protein
MRNWPHTVPLSIRTCVDSSTATGLHSALNTCSGALTQLDLHLSTSIYIRFRLFRSLLSVAPLLLLDFIQYSEYGTRWRAVLLMGIFCPCLSARKGNLSSTHIYACIFLCWTRLAFWKCQNHAWANIPGIVCCLSASTEHEPQSLHIPGKIRLTRRNKLRHWPTSSIPSNPHLSRACTTRNSRIR